MMNNSVNYPIFFPSGNKTSSNNVAGSTNINFNDILQAQLSAGPDITSLLLGNSDGSSSSSGSNNSILGSSSGTDSILNSMMTNSSGLNTTNSMVYQLSALSSLIDKDIIAEGNIKGKVTEIYIDSSQQLKVKLDSGKILDPLSIKSVL